MRKPQQRSQKSWSHRVKETVEISDIIIDSNSYEFLYMRKQRICTLIIEERRTFE